MILIVDMNCKKDSLGFYEFVSPIVTVATEFEECMVKHYTEVSSQDLSQCSRIILSGTALKDNTAANHPEKFSWITTTNKPVFGICAGMQIIAVVFSSQLTRCLEIGMTPITTQKETPLFSDSFRAYSLHNYSVEPNSEFEILAESAQCVQAIKHKKKPLYGVLFHPEVRNTEILKRFIQMKQ